MAFVGPMVSHFFHFRHLKNMDFCAKSMPKSFFLEGIVKSNLKTKVVELSTKAEKSVQKVGQ